MIQNADTSDDPLHLLHTVLQSALNSVGGVANESAALGNSVRALHSNHLSVIVQDFSDVGVQHESSTVNSADSRKSFGDTAETEDRVDERRGIFAH